MQNAHIIETALLLLIAFLIGCAIGWYVRTRFYGANKSAAASGSIDTPTAPPEAAPQQPATAAPAAPAATEAKTEAKKPAAKKASAAKKPAAKKAPAAKKTAAKKEPAKKSPAKKPATAAAPSDAGKPEGLSAPRTGGKDDLKRISGIGPKLEEKLNALGIYHFDQIAAWDRQTIDWVDNHLSFKGRIERDKWLDQAKTMAKE